jgi:serine/threonine protein kinase
MYASPEQSRGERVDHRTDLYALGVMAFEMLAGRTPFEGGTGPEILAKHLLELAPSVTQFVPTLPRKLAVAVDGMLAKDPARRPSLDEVRDAFRDVAASPRIDAPPRRHLRLVVTTALVVAAVMVGIATFIATRSVPSIITSEDSPAPATSERIEVVPPSRPAQTPDASTETSAGSAGSSDADTKPPAAASDSGSDKPATKQPAATKQRAHKRDKPPKKQQTQDPADQDGLL